MKEVHKIAFYGESGSGKSHAVNYLVEKQKEILPEYKVVVVNVAEPLHLIQKYSYELFEIKNSGQDGKLLQFLAEHFENSLGPNCIIRLNKILEESKEEKILILNNDVRNNAHQFLKNESFVFVKIVADQVKRVERVGLRRDIYSFNMKNKVEGVEDIVYDFFLENNGTIKEWERKVENFIREYLNVF